MELYTVEELDRTRRKAHEFHLRNPVVWGHFLMGVRDELRAGRRHFSAQGIIERIRWDRSIIIVRDEGEDEDSPLMDNSHVEFYAFMFLRLCPIFIPVRGHYRGLFFKKKKV